MDQSPSQPKWRKVADRIREAVESGTLRPGDRLGTGPEEAARWGTSHPTLRQAVRKLVEYGLLEEAPRGARVPESKTSTLRLALVRPALGMLGFPGEADREAGFCREVVLQSLRRELQIQTWSVEAEDLARVDGQPRPWNARSVQDFDGAVVSLWNARDPRALLAPFAGRRIPVAVWDERPGGGDDLEKLHLRSFSNGYASDAGRAMAAHLAKLGHRSIAWVSPLHGSLWSRERCDGLLEAARTSAIEVVQHVREVVSHGDLRLPGTASELLDLEPLRSRLGTELSRFSEILAGMADVALRRRALLDLLVPLFQEAAASGSTAWVCANDDVALLAVEWLRGRGIQVPESVSVAGFDDSATARTEGLTSYHFNEADLAAACLSHVLRPDPHRAPGPVRVKGFVVPRGSTGPARTI
jgi:DNA-binding LacI/PurR family transcriptional regulator